MTWKKRLARMGLPILTALALTGCLFGASFNELYQLPRLPAEYTELQAQLDAIQDQGAEYAAPTSGANIQPVQLVDLDGDGTQEAVAFFRRSGDEQPLKIYIFQTDDGAYRQTALIESSGTAFYSVQYTDMDGDGLSELLVSWRASPELQALTVYGLRGLDPVPLMTTNYVRFTVGDLDQDSRQEVTVLRGDGEDNVAEFYTWREDGSLAIQSSTRLSMTMAELQSSTIGTVGEGEPALFVTGVLDETWAVTDILVCREGRLTDLTISPTTGVSGEIARYVGLRPMDVDEDGVTEVPVPVPLLEVEDLAAGTSADWKISWRRYDSLGGYREACQTYHDQEEDWFLFLPEEWDGRIRIRRSGAGDERATVFSFQRQGTFVDFLTIYTLTGANRESRAVRGGRFILLRQGGSTIYAAAFTEEAASWAHTIDEEALRSRFRVIQREWGS